MRIPVKISEFLCRGFPCPKGAKRVISMGCLWWGSAQSAQFWAMWASRHPINVHIACEVCWGRAFFGHVHPPPKKKTTTTISAIGAVNIHCTYCAQELSMTSSSWLPFTINVTRKAGGGKHALFTLALFPRSTASRLVIISRVTAVADPGGIHGVRTPALLTRVPFLKKKPKPHPFSAFGARPPVPLSDGLDTCPCKTLDPPLR